MELKDAAAIVTGGARGIGSGVALALAREGAHVVIADLPSARADMEETRALVEAEGVQALFARATDVRLESRTPADIEGDRATVDVRLEVRRDGEVETVERSWELERSADGVWRFSELPDCY